jgi:hypothetical protein
VAQETKRSTNWAEPVDLEQAMDQGGTNHSKSLLMLTTNSICSPRPQNSWPNKPASCESEGRTLPGRNACVAESGRNRHRPPAFSPPLCTLQEFLSGTKQNKRLVADQPTRLLCKGPWCSDWPRLNFVATCHLAI